MFVAGGVCAQASDAKEIAARKGAIDFIGCLVGSGSLARAKSILVGVRFCQEIEMSELANKTCVPCKGGVPPLKGAELQKFLKQLSKWKVIEEHHLEKSYDFSDLDA